LTHTCGPVGDIGVRGGLESGLGLGPDPGSGEIGVQKEEMGAENIGISVNQQEVKFV